MRGVVVNRGGDWGADPMVDQTFLKKAVSVPNPLLHMQIRGEGEGVAVDQK